MRGWVVVVCISFFKFTSLIISKEPEWNVSVVATVSCCDGLCLVCCSGLQCLKSVMCHGALHLDVLTCCVDLTCWLDVLTCCVNLTCWIDVLT